MSFLLTPAVILQWQKYFAKIHHYNIIYNSKKFEIPKCSKICDSLGKQKHDHTVDYCETYF